MSFSSVDLAPKNDPFGSKQFQIWCLAPSRVKLASSSKIHANVHVNACMFCIMLCAYCAAGHACLNLSLHWPMLLAPHSLVDNALSLTACHFFGGIFQCSCTIQCKVTQEGAAHLAAALSSARLPRRAHFSVGAAHLAAALSSARLPRRAHFPVGAAHLAAALSSARLPRRALTSGGCTCPVQPHYPVHNYTLPVVMALSSE